MDNQLVDHQVPVRVDDAAGTLHGHSAHVCGGGHPGPVRADVLVGHLGELVQISEVHSLVDSNQGEILHHLQEEIHDGEGGVHASVEHALLQEGLVSGSLELLAAASRTP